MVFNKVVEKFMAQQHARTNGGTERSFQMRTRGVEGGSFLTLAAARC